MYFLLSVSHLIDSIDIIFCEGFVSMCYHSVGLKTKFQSH